MKRYLAAVGVGGVVFAAALGSASMLAVNPGVAQASGMQTLRGDSNGVVVSSYGYESDDNSSYFVRVTDVDPSLAGETLWAMIYDGSGNLLAKGHQDIGGTGEVVVHWANPVPFQSIEKVSLTIE